MKKTKQIEPYYCDYCGKECENTPEFVLPSLEEKGIHMDSSSDGRLMKSFSYGDEIYAKQKDICPECQKQIAKLVNLLHYADFAGDDMEKMVYVLLKNSKA